MKKIFVRLSFALLFILFMQIIISILVIRYLLLKDVSENLKTTAQRIQGDLIYKGNYWDTTLYDADPQTPSPNGASGYTNVLYIVTADGIVIERNQPISDYLDASDFKKLLAYQTPQTVQTATDETWRVLSVPIQQGKAIEGVITVSHYDPQPDLIDEIDRSLYENANLLNSRIQMNDSQINVKQIDERNIHYDVSFEIVNKYNQILLNNGRTPSFIDPRFVQSEFAKSPQETIYDPDSKQTYLLYRKKMFDAQKNPIGLIVVGKAVTTIYQITTYFTYLILFMNIFFLFPIAFLLFYFISKPLLKKIPPDTISNPKDILFDKNKSIIIIDKKEIHLPYASNQYYIADALFHKPRKRWEQDELLEYMGDFSKSERANTRKVYDAVLALNKKIGLKFVFHEDKTFFINPSFLQSLKEN